VLTRCVSELRRVFADDAQTPRYIQTVARRGYRLVAAVSLLAGAGRRAGSAPAAPPGPPSPRRRSLGPWLAGAAIALLLGGFWLGRSARPDRPATGSTNPEAQRLYAQAREPLRQALCEGKAAITLLERALELDPAFAAAWEEYGWARYNAVASCGESGENYGRALEAAGRALELAPLSPRATSLKAAILVETGRVEEAHAFLGAAPAPLLADREVRFLGAYALTYAGFLEAAAERVEAIAREDPAFFAAAGWTPNVLLYEAKWERFLELLPRGESPLLRYYRGYALAESGPAGDALRELEPAFRAHPADVFARLAEGLAAILHGRSAEARLLLGQLALQRERLDASDGEVTFKLAELSARAGDPEAALRHLRRAVEQGFFCPPCLDGSRALRPLRAHPAFTALLASARARRAAFARRFRLPPPAATPL
jgi:tetratricopeptide (TPR) repeat protein